MKDLINRGFILVLLVLAGIFIFIGMVAGPIGETEVSLGASIAGCICALSVIIVGLSTWKKKLNRRNK